MLAFLFFSAARSSRATLALLSFLPFFHSLSARHRRTITRLDQAKCGVIYLDEFLRRRDALMAKLVALVTQHRGRDDLRFVAAGGDGTVSWVAELVGDACALVGTDNVPPIAILSLGTGNELARVTGWGTTYSGESLVPFVRDVASGKVVGVDSWLWRATPLDVDDAGKVMDRPRSDARAPSRVVGPRALHDFEGNRVSLFKEEARGAEKARSGAGNDDAWESTSSSRGTRRPGPDATQNVAEAASSISETEALVSSSGRRLSVQFARKMAMENDDLPHLPTLAFAPPPLTPPGARLSPNAKAAKHGSHPTRAPAPASWRGRSEPTSAPASRVTSPTAGADPSSASKHGHARHSRSGSVGGDLQKVSATASPKYPTEPTNNGIGFGRRKNHSRGGSVDFLADGFDDISFDGSDDDDGDLDVVEKTSVCFFSVGFDASIAMQFHQLRERTPCCADSVTKIVAGHAVLGFAEALASRKYLRPGVITLRVDGREVPVPAGARTLQFFNIHSSATGIDFFGCGEKSVPGELQHYEPPNIGDGLIEVVATMSAWHLGAIRLGFGHSHRVAQGASVEMVVRDAIPVQVDGEPWLQPPAVIHVSAQGKIPFVLGRGEKRNVPTVGHVRRPSVVRTNPS
jgi:diacylglycerol kinase (ATP)